MKKSLFILLILGFHYFPVNAMEKILSDPLSRETKTKMSWAAGIVSLITAVGNYRYNWDLCIKKRAAMCVGCGAIYGSLAAGISYWMSPERYVRSKARKIKKFDESAMHRIVSLATLSTNDRGELIKEIKKSYPHSKPPFYDLCDGLESAKITIDFKDQNVLLLPLFKDSRRWNDNVEYIKSESRYRQKYIDESLDVLDALNKQAKFKKS